MSQNNHVENDTKCGIFLPPKHKTNRKKKTLVLDLDETLIHSGLFRFKSDIDITFNINIDNSSQEVTAQFRPGAEEFLSKMASKYEIVIFTASLSNYALPIIKRLDSNNVCSHKLFREHCTMKGNSFVKELKKLGRDLKDMIIIDNSPVSYINNTDNGIPITTWIDDKYDRELFTLIPLLDFLSEVNDVRKYIKRMSERNDYTLNYALTLKNAYDHIQADDIKENTIQLKDNKNNMIIISKRDNQDNEKNQTIMASSYFNNTILPNIMTRGKSLVGKDTNPLSASEDLKSRNKKSIGANQTIIKQNALMNTNQFFYTPNSKVNMLRKKKVCDHIDFNWKNPPLKYNNNKMQVKTKCKVIFKGSLNASQNQYINNPKFEAFLINKGFPTCQENYISNTGHNNSQKPKQILVNTTYRI